MDSTILSAIITAVFSIIADKINNQIQREESISESFTALIEISKEFEILYLKNRIALNKNENNTFHRLQASLRNLRNYKDRFYDYYVEEGLVIYFYKMNR